MSLLEFVPAVLLVLGSVLVLRAVFQADRPWPREVEDKPAAREAAASLEEPRRAA